MAAVSRENVELVRESQEHFARTGEPMWERMHPEVEFWDHDLPDGSVSRGHRGYGEFVEAWEAAFESYSLEPEEYIDAGDAVVMVFTLRATGRGSGIELERRDAIVYTLAEGLVTRLDYFNNPAEALEAAGLSPENPEIVRRAFKAFSEGGVDALLEFVDERCVMITGGDVASEPDTYRGHDGARRYFESFYEVMDRIAVEVLDLEALSGGRVVGSLRLTARGRASGIEAAQNGEMLCALAGGKLMRIEFFPTREEALAAASRDWGSRASGLP